MSLLDRRRLGVVVLLVGMSSICCARPADQKRGDQRGGGQESALPERNTEKAEAWENALADKARTDSAIKTLGLDGAARPMNMMMQVDEKRGVNRVIGPKGGSLSLSDADGARFTLEIPKGALFADTLIEMTPVTSLSGLAFSSGLVGAVRLRPDGLQLAIPAVLSIEAAQPTPSKDQIAFGSQGDGQDVHLIPLVPSAKGLGLHILHFSNNGSVTVEPGALQFEGGSIKWVEGHWPRPTTPLDRLEQAVARSIKEQTMLEALGYDAGSSIMRDVVKNGEERVRAARFLYYQDLVRRLRAAAADCSNVDAVASVVAEHNAAEHTRAVLGGGGGEASALDQLVFSVVRKCTQIPLEQCRAGEAWKDEDMLWNDRIWAVMGWGAPYTEKDFEEIRKCRLNGWSGRISYRETYDLSVNRGSSGTRSKRADIVFQQRGKGHWTGTATGSTEVKFEECLTRGSENYSGSGSAVLIVAESGAANEGTPSQSVPPEAVRINLSIQPDGNYDFNFEVVLNGTTRTTHTGPRYCSGPEQIDDQPEGVSAGAVGKTSPEARKLSGAQRDSTMVNGRKAGETVLVWILNRGQ